MRHATRTELEAVLPVVAASPRESGRLEMIVVRPGEDVRETPDEVRCTVHGGIDGDDWAARGSRHTPDGSANPDQQVAVTNARFLDAISGSRERWPLAGDQLVVDLDLSSTHLSAGDRLRIGEVELEVTDHPHNGCLKYRDRFGRDALEVASAPANRQLRLRGLYVRVVVPGTIRVGETITCVRAPEPAATG